MKSLTHLRAIAAFTMSELMVSLAIFGIMAGVSMVALTHMNNRAFLSRCQTGASTIAMNQIDLILSSMPFNPQKTPTPQIPPELTGDPQPGDGTPSNPTLPIYTDPQTNTVLIKGWMTRYVDKTSLPNNTFRATITVSYRYRGKQYDVKMSTMRCPDI